VTVIHQIESPDIREEMFSGQACNLSGMEYACVAARRRDLSIFDGTTQLRHDL